MESQLRSSLIESVEIDRETGEMVINFVSGASYAYGNTSSTDVVSLLTAESPGRWFIENIRSHPELYPARRIG
mgnify:CR=1 FL=1